MERRPLEQQVHLQEARLLQIMTGRGAEVEILTPILLVESGAAGHHPRARPRPLCQLDACGSNLAQIFPSGFRLSKQTSFLAGRCGRQAGKVPFVRKPVKLDTREKN